MHPPPPASTLFPYTTLFRSIFMVTDGKPSAIFDANGRLYKNSFGLDPRIVNKTLDEAVQCRREKITIDRKSTRLNSSHQIISYAVFCLKKKKTAPNITTAMA